MTRAPELESFEGHWRLSRVIHDRHARVDGGVSGEAVFIPREDGGLDYAEEGALVYAGQPPIDATRKFIWRSVKDGIAVDYEDGRPFHRFTTDRLIPEAQHHCDPDMYYVIYDFTRWPDWRTIWRVMGPKKDYRMETEYRRNVGI